MHFKLQHLKLVNAVLNFKIDVNVLGALSFSKNVFVRHLLAFVYMRLILKQSVKMEGFGSVKQLNGRVAAVVVSTLV